MMTDSIREILASHEDWDNYDDVDLFIRARAELATLEKALSESEAKEAERIAIGTALGWLMEASEVNLGSGDDEFDEAWLNAESVMCNMPQGSFLSLYELEKIFDAATQVLHEVHDTGGISNPSFYKMGNIVDGLAAKIKQAKGE